MGPHTVISVVLVCIITLVSLQQVVGQESNEENVEDSLPSVIMINQVAILEATHALKAVLNSTQDDQHQHCETKDVLVSMRESLARSEEYQSILFNSSIEAWSALSEVPSTLTVIAEAAETYKPDDCKDTKKVTNRLDKLISAVKDSSDTTAQAIQALQNNTMMMMEVLQQSINLQSETYGRMRNEIEDAKNCCNGIEQNMENLVKVVTDIHKEMKGCREGSPCSNGGVMKPCDDKNRGKRQTALPDPCHLCCEEPTWPLGTIKPGIIPPHETVTWRVDVQTVPETDIPQGAVCCPAGFMIVGNECFYISGKLSTWFRARRTCQDKGGYIAKPTNTNALAQEIMNNYQNKRWYWIERSDLDGVRIDDEDSVSPTEHNCHVLDAGQEDNIPHLLPSSCMGSWYFICQHQLNDECASLRNQDQQSFPNQLYL